jgi:uncharacterized protein YkwD
VISPGRRSSVLLLSIATGSLLVGSFATATASPATPSAPSTAAASRQAADLVDATNHARREAGCAPVESDARLNRTAQAHAEDMARGGYFSHTSQDGTTSGDRIAEGGFSATGENIASGYPTAAEVMQVWMESASHRRNIEDCGFSAIGVGYVADGHHWVQDFGG